MSGPYRREELDLEIARSDWLLPRIPDRKKVTAVLHT